MSQLTLHSGYDCNDKTADQRYATSLYNDITLSAPAFEIRWRSGDVNGEFTHPPPPVSTSTSELAASRSTGQTQSSGGASSASPTPSGTEHKATGDVSAGKIAGIVTGAVAAMCAVLAAACILRVRFRRKYIFTKAQLKSEKGGDRGDAIAELDPGAGPIAELQSERPAKELDSNRPKQYDDYTAINKEPVEMPGDSILGSLL